MPTKPKDNIMREIEIEGAKGLLLSYLESAPAHIIGQFNGIVDQAKRYPAVLADKTFFEDQYVNAFTAAQDFAKENNELRKQRDKAIEIIESGDGNDFGVISEKAIAILEGKDVY